jgi:hypothetical protein
MFFTTSTVYATVLGSGKIDEMPDFKGENAVVNNWWIRVNMFYSSGHRD